MRYIAAQLVGNRFIEKAVFDLRLALIDTSMWVRVEAANAFSKLGALEAVDELIDGMRTRDGPDVEAAQKALYQITGEEYVVVD